jgi:glyoxylase-like metal-dependent hydrolase (beta-lactamase superfamily II)
MHVKKYRLIALIPALAGLAANLHAQMRSPAKIETTQLADNIYMLSGAGGNVGVLTGDDGVLLIDSGLAPHFERITTAVKAVCEAPIRLIVNTHWHFDHVGGNVEFTKAGALLIAHEDVRRRMTTEQTLGALGRKVPPAPAAALPVTTYREELTLHWNGEEVHIFHLDPAHTDGDSVVHFRKANVLHLGDVFFSGMYPFIDAESGGSIDGVIKAVDRVLTIVDGETKIIPGHGPVSGVSELTAYRSMLARVRDRVRALVDQGLSRNEVVASKPTKDINSKWGGGGIGADMWVAIIYDGMTTE